MYRTPSKYLQAPVLLTFGNVHAVLDDVVSHHVRGPAVVVDGARAGFGHEGAALVHGTVRFGGVRRLVLLVVVVKVMLVAQRHQGQGVVGGRGKRQMQQGIRTAGPRGTGWGKGRVPAKERRTKKK